MIENMNLKFLGIVLIILGGILITRKKKIIKKEQDYIIWALIMAVYILLGTIELFYGEENYIVYVILYNVLFNMIITLPLTISAINKFTNTYDVFNANIQMVVLLITNILEEKDIPYEKGKKAIFLKDYNGYIYYKKLVGVVNIDFKSIEDVAFQEEIIKELQSRIKDVEAKVFPVSGVVNIGMGIMMLVLSIYII